MLVHALHIGAGMGMLVGIQSLAMAVAAGRGKTFYLFAAVCLSGAAHLYFSAEWYSAQTLEQAAFVLRQQTAAALLYTVSFVWFITLYAKERRAHKALQFFSLLAMALLAYNYLKPYGLVYDSLRIAPPLAMPDRLASAPFVGSYSPVLILLYILFLSAYTWSAWCTLTLYRTRSHHIGHLYVAYLGIQLLAVLGGLMTGHSVIESLYLAGNAFLWLIVICSVKIVLDVRENAERRRRESEYRVTTELEFRSVALVDSLTGLPSRCGLLEQFDRFVSGAKAGGRHPVMYLLGLDSLSNINHTFGYVSGNVILCDIAARLRRRVEPRGIVARVGGGEFAVLYAATDTEIRALTEQASSDTVAQMPWLEATATLGNQKIHTPFSTGAVILQMDDGDLFEVLLKAELALQAARERARRVPVVFDEELAEKIRREQRLVNDLSHALEHGGLSLHFQPKVTTNGSVAGAEVLLRWEHPRLGNLLPETFIPIAEKSGLIGALNEWVLRESCRTLVRWRTHGEPFSGRLAINLGGHQLQSTGINDYIERILGEYRLPASVIALEINEGALTAEAGVLDQKIRKLRSQGIHLTVDNFGTGCGSLSCLYRLPVDAIKIDKSLIRQLDDISASNSAKLVRGIVGIAASLGIQVIAGGVETENERRALERMGCELYQGYLFSRPVAEADFLQWLSSWQLAQGYSRALANSSSSNPPLDT